jgi:hypothetical protein
MKKLNKTAICFLVVFILIFVFRFTTLEIIDKLFYLLAITGFFIMSIGPMLNKK